MTPAHPRSLTALTGLVQHVGPVQSSQHLKGAHERFRTYMDKLIYDAVKIHYSKKHRFGVTNLLRLKG